MEELFNKLQKELKLEITQSVSSRDLVNLAQASKYHLALFKPIVDARKLLPYAVRGGEHDVIESILKDDISLIFKKGKVTDCSGRTFNNISVFEYALWALDKHMWTM